MFFAFRSVHSVMWVLVTVVPEMFFSQMRFRYRAINVLACQNLVFWHHLLSVYILLISLLSFLSSIRTFVLRLLLFPIATPNDFAFHWIAEESFFLQKSACIYFDFPFVPEWQYIYWWAPNNSKANGNTIRLSNAIALHYNLQL